MRPRVPVAPTGAENRVQVLVLAVTATTAEQQHMLAQPLHSTSAPAACLHPLNTVSLVLSNPGVQAVSHAVSHPNPVSRDLFNDRLLILTLHILSHNDFATALLAWLLDATSCRPELASECMDIISGDCDGDTDWTVAGCYLTVVELKLGSYISRWRH